MKKGGKNRNEMERRGKKGRWGGCGKTFLSSPPSPPSPQSITSLFYHCQNCRVEKITGLPEIVHKKGKIKKRSFYNYPSFEPGDMVKMAILYAFWQLCLPIIIRCRALAPLSRTSTLFFRSWWMWPILITHFLFPSSSRQLCIKEGTVSPFFAARKNNLSKAFSAVAWPSKEKEEEGIKNDGKIIKSAKSAE